jgi:hypothetical protein
MFVQCGIETRISLRDTDKPLDDIAKALDYQEKERLEPMKQT